MNSYTFTRNKLVDNRIVEQYWHENVCFECRCVIFSITLTSHPFVFTYHHQCHLQKSIPCCCNHESPLQLFLLSLTYKIHQLYNFLVGLLISETRLQGLVFSTITPLYLYLTVQKMVSVLEMDSVFKVDVTGNQGIGFVYQKNMCVNSDIYSWFPKKTVTNILKLHPIEPCWLNNEVNAVVIVKSF